MINAIVMTATVTPQFKVALFEPQARIAGYRHAVRSWLDGSGALVEKVILVENSGADLTRITSSVPMELQHRLIAVSAPYPSEEQTTRGKGSAEAYMVDYAVRMLNLPRESTIGKVTGRFQVVNLRHAITGTPQQPFIRARMRMDLSFLDTRFFISSKGAYEDYFMGMHAEVNEGAGHWIEHVAARRLHRALADGVEFSRFPNPPMLRGISGSTGHHHAGITWGSHQIVEAAFRRVTKAQYLWV